MTFMFGTVVIDTGLWMFFRSIGNKIYKATALYSSARAASELSRQGYNNEAAWLIQSLKNNRSI
jgi:hypothetical protein